MNLSKDVPIIIYGCGYLGVLLLKTLESQGLFVECGIDKRGDELTSFCNKPAISLVDSKKINEKDKKIVVIAVKNVFEHESIAKKLYEAGFTYILYKPHDAIEGKFDEYTKKINGIYESILLLSRPKDQQGGGIVVLQGLQVPQYKPHKKIYVDQHSIIKDGDIVISYVPTAMIFTDEAKGDKKDVRNVSDVPLLMSLAYSELYDYFQFNNKYPTKYIEFCKEAVSADEVKPTKRWIENILKNRYMIYMNMLSNLNLDFDFFLRNAPLARWNDKGYFNLMGGKSRSTFLISQNYNYIPLKITREDYNRWYNDIQVTMEFDCDEFLEPIEHPAFFDIHCDNKLFYFSLQKQVMRLLAENYSYPRVKTLSILDVSKNNGFLARSLSKIIETMDVMQEDIENEQLFFKLSKFFNISKVNVVKKYYKKYDVIIAEDDSYDSYKNIIKDTDAVIVSYPYDKKSKYESYGFKKIGNGIKNYQQWEYAVKY